MTQLIGGIILGACLAGVPLYICGFVHGMRRSREMNRCLAEVCRRQRDMNRDLADIEVDYLRG